MASLKSTSTLEQFIEAGSAVTISYANLSMLDETGDIKIPIYNVVSDYLFELLGKSTTVVLNDQEFWKYKYKPKLLAVDIYGNAELYFVILMLNNMCSVKEFDIKRIKMLSKKDMSDLLGLIYSSEMDFLAQYNDKTENNL